MPANNVVVTANWRYLPSANPLPTNSSSITQQIIPTPSEPAPSDDDQLSDEDQTSGGGFNLLLIVAIMIIVIAVVGTSLYFLKGKK